MNCLLNAFKLFETNACEATILTVLAFVVGVLATLGFCKLACKRRGCAKCSDKANGPSQKRAPAKEQRFEKKHPAPADGSIEIYVGNLSYDLTEEQLRKEFAAYGTVNSARIITNRFNGRSKGFGFVHMPNRDEVNAALKALNDKEILGRRLKCNEAKNVG